MKNCGAAQHNPEFMADWRTCQAPYDSQCTSHAGGPGASDADFVLYVTAKLEEACSPPYRAVASGGFCLVCKRACSFKSVVSQKLLRFDDCLLPVSNSQC